MKKATDTHSDDTGRDNDRHAGTKSSQRMEREVDQARARVGRTLNELTDRLSPGELLDQALDLAREHGGEFGRNLGAQVKNNPMPMILTSVGLSWMMMSSGHNGAAHAYGTSADTDESGFMDTLGDTARKSRDKMAAAGDSVHGATANAKKSAHDARETLVQFYRDQPLIAGSLGIAIGAALGALVPPSEVEDDMVGEASDRSVEAARSKAAQTYDEVRESTRSAHH